MTLLEAATIYLVHDRDKHDLGETFVEDRVNYMTNYQFLEFLSEGLEKMREEIK